MVEMQAKLFFLAVSILGGFVDKIQHNPALINRTYSLNTIEDLVIGVLEEAKALFLTGVPEIGVPVLDPLKIDAFPLNLAIPDLLALNLSLSDGNLAGLSNFNVTDLEININGEKILPLDAALEVTFNNLELVSNYKVEGAMGQDELFGSGVFVAQLRGFRLKISISTGSHCNVITLDELGLEHGLESAYFFMTGFKNDPVESDKLSETLTSAVPFLLDNVEFGPLFTPQIKKTLNKILAFLLFEVPEL